MPTCSPRTPTPINMNKLKVTCFLRKLYCYDGGWGVSKTQKLGLNCLSDQSFKGVVLGVSFCLMETVKLNCLFSQKTVAVHSAVTFCGFLCIKWAFLLANIQIDNNFSWFILLSTIEMTSKKTFLVDYIPFIHVLVV